MIGYHQDGDNLITSSNISHRRAFYWTNQLLINKKTTRTNCQVSLTASISTRSLQISFGKSSYNEWLLHNWKCYKKQCVPSLININTCKPILPIWLLSTGCSFDIRRGCLLATVIFPLPTRPPLTMHSPPYHSECYNGDQRQWPLSNSKTRKIHWFTSTCNINVFFLCV